MNFKELKGMVDGIIEGYICPDCNIGVGEEQIEIIGTAGINVNLEVSCPKCGKNAIVKGQVLNIDFGKLGLSQDKLMKIKNKTVKTKKKNSIKNKEISDLLKKLNGKNFSMSDLFGN